MKKFLRFAVAILAVSALSACSGQAETEEVGAEDAVEAIEEAVETIEETVIEEADSTAAEEGLVDESVESTEEAAQ